MLVADDDGVVVVPRAGAAEALEAPGSGGKEARSWSGTRNGELSLDVSAMRDRLAAEGLFYVDAEDAR